MLVTLLTTTILLGGPPAPSPANLHALRRGFKTSASVVSAEKTSLDDIGKAIQANAAKFPALKLNLDPAAAKFKSVDLAPGLFRIDGDPYVAFKFTMPADGSNRRFMWGLALSSLNSWYVRDASGAEISAFTEFSLDGDKNVRQFLTPGRLPSSKSYVMWMKLQHARAPVAQISLNAYRDDQLTQGWFATATPKEGGQFAVTQVGETPVSSGGSFFSHLRRAKLVKGKLGGDTWNRFDLSDAIVRHGGKAYALLNPSGTGSNFEISADMLLFSQYEIHGPGLRQFGTLTYGELIELKSDIGRERTYAYKISSPSTAPKSVKACGLLDKGPQTGLSRHFYLWIELDDTVEPIVYLKSDLVAIPWKLALGTLPGKA